MSGRHTVGRSLACAAIAIALAACPNPADKARPASDKELSAFSFAKPAATGLIDRVAGTVEVIVPYGTSLGALVASFEAKADDVAVGAVAQKSGATPNDFSKPVVYTLTAADGTQAEYHVIVRIASSSAKAITGFVLVGFSPFSTTISEKAKTITISAPYKTDPRSKIAMFETTGQSVAVGGLQQRSGATVNDFSSPLTYTVTAADDSTTSYKVTLAIAKNTATAITGFSLKDRPETFVIEYNNKNTVKATLPYFQDRRFIAQFILSDGATAKIGSVAQTNGVTVNDFSSPLSYWITAADTSYHELFTVTVSFLPAPKAITSFGIRGFPDAVSDIDEAAKTIVVSLPSGSDLSSALVPIFKTTGTGLQIGGELQTSDGSSVDFSSSAATPIVYTVNSLDGIPATYSVIVAVAPEKPVVSVGGGSLATVSMSCATAGASIRYTTDGSEPNFASALYAGPFSFLSRGQVLSFKAISVKTVARSASVSAQAGSIGALALTADVSRLAGPMSSNASGYVDGGAAAARFCSPQALASDGANLYVADTANHRIRKIVIATGAVSTLAGSGSAAYADGKGIAASFNRPCGVATDGSFVYVSDYMNFRIRKIEIATGEVTTLSGSGYVGMTDGSSDIASFTGPEGLATDGSFLYVSDIGSSVIRRVRLSTGEVSSLWSGGTRYLFKQTTAVATDGSCLYVSDYPTHSIWKFDLATNEKSLLAGAGIEYSASNSFADGVGSEARFKCPAGLWTDGVYLYAADTQNSAIRRIELSSKTVTTLAGAHMQPGESEPLDGHGASAVFGALYGIASDGEALFVTDATFHNIRAVH